MEKLEKVIAGLERCVTAGGCIGCEYNDYTGGFDKCRERLMCDAQDVLRELDGKYRAAVEMAAIATERAAARSGGDLISRSALMEVLKEKHDWVMQDPEISPSVKWGEAVCNGRVREAIEKAPAVEAEPVVHAHWIERASGTHNICSNCHTGVPVVVSVKGWLRCCICGAHMDEGLEIRTCYCPVCDKHFKVRSNASSGNCPECGHHVVLYREEVAK